MNNSWNILCLFEAGAYRLFRPLPWSAVTLAVLAAMLLPATGWVSVLCNVGLATLTGAGWFLVVLGLPADEDEVREELEAEVPGTIGAEVRR